MLKQRTMIKIYLEAGLSLRLIAQRINKSLLCIRYEIRNNSSPYRDLAVRELKMVNKTIYNWIDHQLLDVLVTDLLDRGIRRKCTKELRGAFIHGRSIEQRAPDRDNRTEFGHFEADTL